MDNFAALRENVELIKNKNDFTKGLQCWGWSCQKSLKNLFVWGKQSPSDD